MTLKTLVSALALSTVLALGSPPVFAQSQPVDISDLTPAQRTQLEDQCRQMANDDNASANSDSDDSDDDNNAPFKVSRAYCFDIGIV